MSRNNCFFPFNPNWASNSSSIGVQLRGQPNNVLKIPVSFFIFFTFLKVIQSLCCHCFCNDNKSFDETLNFVFPDTLTKGQSYKILLKHNLLLLYQHKKRAPKNNELKSNLKRPLLGLSQWKITSAYEEPRSSGNPEDSPIRLAIYTILIAFIEAIILWSI